jgi:4-carboxymuconolactone decarboxylase
MDSHYPAPTARELFGDTAPKLLELIERLLFGDIWERPELSRRDRSLITVAALIALDRTRQLPFYLERALADGLTRDELVEAITHVAFYSGWPTAVSAATIAKEVFRQDDSAKSESR